LKNKALKKVIVWAVVLGIILSWTFVTTANTKTIGVVLPNMAISWYQTVFNGMDELAEEYGVRIVAANCNNDVSQELNHLEALAARQVDAIVISAVTSASSVPAINNIVESGVPVIAFNMPVETDKVEAFVGIDNVRLGALAGIEAQKYISENNLSDINVAILTNIGSQAAQDRVQGFLGELTEVNIENTVIEHGLALDDSMNVMESVLQANEHIDIVYCFNEGSTIGALRAVQESRRDIAVFGTDMTNTFVSYLRESTPLKAIATQEPYEIGRMALETAIKQINGEELPDRIMVPVSVVTPDNIEEYLQEANMPQ